MLTSNDGALVRAARDGDVSAFALLLVRHRPMVLALCRQKLRDPALAEDAVQEASLQALLHLDRLHQVERFGSWLAGIGLNICRLWLRGHSWECCSWDALEKTSGHHRHGENEAPAPAPGGLHLVASTGRHDDPEARAAEAELAASVQAAIAALPLGQQTAVRLFYLSELSSKETAAMLGIAEGAVRTRL